MQVKSIKTRAEERERERERERTITISSAFLLTCNHLWDPMQCPIIDLMLTKPSISGKKMLGFPARSQRGNRLTGEFGFDQWEGQAL